MPYDRQFAAGPVEVLEALERAIRQLEKFRSTNPATRVIYFGTKTSGWSWGSRWAMHVQSLGSGSVATASIVSAGSLVAERSEGKKIRDIFDAAERLLPRTAMPSLFDSNDAVVQPLRIHVEPSLSPKYQHLVSPVLQALAEAEAAAAEGQVVDEELAIARARRIVASAGAFAFRPNAWCEEEIHARVAGGSLRRGVELIAKVGANLLLMSDRILQGETVRVMDDRVEASVEKDGQIVQSTRPTLTRMAVGSVLPGSALLVGLAVPKTTRTDLRTASFVLAHPEWRTIEPIDPDGAHEVSGIAGQVNALVAERRRAARLVLPEVATASIADEIAKLAALRASGLLTDEEFAAAKARLLP